MEVPIILTMNRVVERPEVLDEELAFFAASLPGLMESHEGEFVVIKGRSLLGTYPGFSEAHEAGVEAFGLVPFLVREITTKEEPPNIPLVVSIP